ncbi:MAG: M28 family peptidase [Holophagales bacterium]|nr:MAG: M28 family peptidase [Holophagales bacterium]
MNPNPARRRLRVAAAVLAALALLTSPATAAAPAASTASTDAALPRILGFTAESSAAQRALEARLDASLVAADQRTWMEELAGQPHHVGSPGDARNAERLAALFRGWGYETAIEEFQVLFPTPKRLELEMVAPHPHRATLVEPAIPGDSSATRSAGALPLFNAYSIDGDVTGELVYVNQGLPEDYEELARRGIDVRGRIVLARYGGSWRGVKPKVAAEHGALACILYTDPRGDGYYQGDPYPQGGFRPPGGAQRGSVADMPIYSGDPLTPGVGATRDAVRLPLAEARVLTHIPVLPISAADAQPLLAALGGAVVPEGWRGALPLTYHFGPGPARVHLALAFDWRLTTIRDVIARLPGRELPDQWIVRGNHHDAWVFGATDPVSGLVAMLDEARAVAALARAGSPPRRTVIYAAWDGEEVGLLGSTEWAEAHADELARHAVAYLNTDSSTSGMLGAGGSATLTALVEGVAREVRDPRRAIPVADRLRAAALLGSDEEAKRAARAGHPVQLEPLGSGSDFTPFLQHLGIASLNLGFGGEDEYGQYHSAYDSVEHFHRFMDSDHAYGVAMAQVGGRLTLRLANADLLPFAPTAFAKSVAGFVDEVEALTVRMRREAEERQEALAAGLYEAAQSARVRRTPPPPLDAVPFLNFAPLDNAVTRLVASAEACEHALTTAEAVALPAASRREIDRILGGLEATLTSIDGLPDRPWYRNLLYAPGQYTGYGTKTLPAVREAIELRRWKEAEAEVPRLAAALERFAAALDQAAARARDQAAATTP